jgi:S1-C subfamily serine protease
MKSTAISGIQVSEISDSEKKSLGIRYGLKVVSSQSLAVYDPNVNEGFIITTVNGVPVKSVEHFRALLSEHDGVMLGGFYCDGTHDHYYFENLSA